MNVPPSELAAVHLDRSDHYECVLDNLRRARTLDEQKRILRGWEAGLLRNNSEIEDPAAHPTPQKLHGAFEWLRSVALSEDPGSEKAAAMMYEIGRLRVLERRALRDGPG